MGDLNDPFMRNQNAAVQSRTKVQNRSNVLQLKLVRLFSPIYFYDLPLVWSIALNYRDLLGFYDSNFGCCICRWIHQLFISGSTDILLLRDQMLIT